MFQCPHCSKYLPMSLPFIKCLENGRAYAQMCSGCGYVVGVRPKLTTDPEYKLEEKELNYLRFHRIIHKEEINAQIRGNMNDDENIE